MGPGQSEGSLEGACLVGALISPVLCPAPSSFTKAAPLRADASRPLRSSLPSHPCPGLVSPSEAGSPAVPTPRGLQPENLQMEAGAWDSQPGLLAFKPTGKPPWLSTREDRGAILAPSQRDGCRSDSASHRKEPGRRCEADALLLRLHLKALFMK